MSIVELNSENRVMWEASGEIRRVGAIWMFGRETFVATGGTPPERIGAAIVDEFAQDLRQLGDA